MKRIAEISPRLKARVAGALYVLAIVLALIGEFVIRGRPGVAVALIAVPCYVLVTLLVYEIFKLVNRNLALLLAACNLVGLLFEALQLNPGGVDIALVFHGLYCLLIGYLILRSAFLPSILGALIVLAGLGWLTFLYPPLADHVSPYNLGCGIVGEAALMLWFLVMGVNLQRWKGRAGAAGVSLDA